MNFNNSINNLTDLNSNLALKINNFRSNLEKKTQPFVYEKNSFDIFIDKCLIDLRKIIVFINDQLRLKYLSLKIVKMLNKVLNKIINSISTYKENSNKLVLKANFLEKKLDDQENIIKINLNENRKLREEITKINSTLTKILDNPEKHNKNIIPESIGHNSISKVDFYQEENIRLGSELNDTRKKFEILKSEIDKYQIQRSNLITKINSVNEALDDTNVLTNVFENEVKNKVNIVDHNKLEKRDKTDINEKVKNIFNSK